MRRALVSTWGAELGREAAADALVYAWRHWEKVQGMNNPAGYLYTIGKRSVRPPASPPLLPPKEPTDEPWVEPKLDHGLALLTDHQRTAVVLHHGFSWTYQEIGDVLGVAVSTVRNHIARGMQKLREVLEVKVDD